MSDSLAPGDDENAQSPLRRRRVPLSTSWQPVSPASSWWERAADRYLAWWEAIAGGYRVLLLVVLVSFLGWLMPNWLAMVPMGVFVLTVGLGCAVGFLRCRTAHCAITGVGLPVVGVLTITQAVIKASWLDFYVWIAIILAIIGVGFAFQGLWARTHGGSHVCRPRP